MPEPKDFFGPAVAAIAAVLSWIAARKARKEATAARTDAKAAHDDRMAIEKLKLNREEEWRQEDKEAKKREREAEARERRIAEVLARWETFDSLGGGIPQFLRSGALTLHSDEELREAADRLVNLEYRHPFGGYFDFFVGIDALDVLKRWETFPGKSKGTSLEDFLNATRRDKGLPPETPKARR